MITSDLRGEKEKSLSGGTGRCMQRPVIMNTRDLNLTLPQSSEASLALLHGQSHVEETPEAEDKCPRKKNNNVEGGHKQ